MLDVNIHIKQVFLLFKIPFDLILADIATLLQFLSIMRLMKCPTRSGEGVVLRDQYFLFFLWLYWEFWYYPQSAAFLEESTISLIHVVKVDLVKSRKHNA